MFPVTDITRVAQSATFVWRIHSVMRMNLQRVAPDTIRHPALIPYMCVSSDFLASFILLCQVSKSYITPGGSYAHGEPLACDPQNLVFCVRTNGCLITRTVQHAIHNAVSTPANCTLRKSDLLTLMRAALYLLPDVVYASGDTWSCCGSHNCTDNAKNCPNCPDPTDTTFHDPMPQKLLADFNSIATFTVTRVSATVSLSTPTTRTHTTSSTSFKNNPTSLSVSPSASASSPSSSKSSTTESTSSHSYLSTGAKVGIGVGAAVGAIILGVLFIYFLRNFRVVRRNHRLDKDSREYQDYISYLQRKPELDSHAERSIEAFDCTRTELPTARVRHETEGVGRHELNG